MILSSWADGESDPAPGGGAAVFFHQHLQRASAARAYHLQGTHIRGQRTLLTSQTFFTRQTFLTGGAGVSATPPARIFTHENLDRELEVTIILYFNIVVSIL